jgi:hypothetical protein
MILTPGYCRGGSRTGAYSIGGYRLAGDAFEGTGWIDLVREFGGRAA